MRFMFVGSASSPAEVFVCVTQCSSRHSCLFCCLCSANERTRSEDSREATHGYGRALPRVSHKCTSKGI